MFKIVLDSIYIYIWLGIKHQALKRVFSFFYFLFKISICVLILPLYVIREIFLANFLVNPYFLVNILLIKTSH